ncbi:hypothetical protein HJ01_00723 [Flavobacterium frigoris PS1]|uniref:Uncharacterized protein n=1 Tax=Flavobacterium frigoris (strain PS1) TaxID=1086011 RepID=H7FNQ3_FLAFP|nr:hypothetical protein HJ01_00723 [Flavobacterium frigoris PS1]
MGLAIKDTCCHRGYASLFVDFISFDMKASLASAVERQMFEEVVKTKTV